MFEIDKPRCFCGVFGIFGHPQASTLTYFGLHALQHRGQEAAGIVSLELEELHKAKRFNMHRGNGLVTDVFKNEKILTEVLKGTSAIGHNRYSTTGSSQKPANIQPFMVHYRDGNLALAHNGNLTNTRAIRARLEDEGTIFQTTTDSEVVLHLIAKSRKDTQIEQIQDALNDVEGAFSLVILTDTSLVAARDAYGFRPLALGRKNNSYVVASETCAFDIIGAEYIRDIAPGEILVIDGETLETGAFRSYWLEHQVPKYAHCIFEFIYFSRPDSKIFGENVDKVRRRLGKRLAEEHPVIGEDGEHVYVISVPDSSNTATVGYVSQSNKLGYPAKYEIGLIRNHYVGRTFIQPEQNGREMAVRTKYNTVKGVLKGRKVVIVDDSIVRGTTSKQLVKLVREAEPAEVHFRVTSPPIKNPCYYGMDFPSREELIAVRCSGDVGRIQQELGADTLMYLSIEKMLESVPAGERKGYCTACFSGTYPVPVEIGVTKEEHEV